MRNKLKATAHAGMDSWRIELPADIYEDALLKQIDDTNNDPIVDGILAQLPHPKHINEKKVINTIVREKDVDGFHPGTVADLWLGTDSIAPCTLTGTIRLINSIGYSYWGIML